MTSADPIVRTKHVRQAKLCLRGAREWAAHNDISYSEFVTNGLPASVLEATGDPFAMRAAQIAREDPEA